MNSAAPHSPCSFYNSSCDLAPLSLCGNGPACTGSPLARSDCRFRASGICARAAVAPTAAESISASPDRCAMVWTYFDSVAVAKGMVEWCKFD